MGKKVRVTTACGEEFFYEHDQEVKTVEIIETEKIEKLHMIDEVETFLLNICNDISCSRCPLSKDNNGCLRLDLRDTAGWQKKYS